MRCPFLQRIKNDTHFRIKTFLFLSLVFNLLYSAFLFVVSRVFFSKWFFIMSIYYGLLSIARIFIFFQTDFKKNKQKKILMMRTCGYFLLLLNVIVSIMMFLLIYTTNHVKHHEITVITLATYTFTTLTLAIIGTIKHFKGDNSLYSSIKIVSLISASVSIVTLTNTMLATFGDGENHLRSIILPILSAFVAIFIIVCAILMIIKANKQLRKLKNEQK